MEFQLSLEGLVDLLIARCSEQNRALSRVEGTLDRNTTRGRLELRYRATLMHSVSKNVAYPMSDTIIKLEVDGKFINLSYYKTRHEKGVSIEYNISLIENHVEIRDVPLNIPIVELLGVTFVDELPKKKRRFRFRFKFPF